MLLAPGSRITSLSTPSDALTDDTLTAVALSPTGLHAVYARRSSRVALYDVHARCSKPLSVQKVLGVVSHIVFDASGAYFALATADGNVHVFSREKAALTHMYNAATPGSMLTTVAFHSVPDEAALLLAAEDGSIRRCDLSRPRSPPVVVSRKHVAAVCAFAFADEGSAVVTASADTLLCFAKWGDMASGKLVATEEELVALVRPGEEDCSVVLSIGQRGIIRRWDARTGREDVDSALELPFVSPTQEEIAKKCSDSEEEEDPYVPVQPVSMTMCGPEELVVSMSDHTLVFVPVSKDGELRGVRKVVAGNLEEIYDVRVLSNRVIAGKSSQQKRDVAIASNSSILWIMRMSGQLDDNGGQPVDVEDGSQPADDLETKTWSCHAGLSGHTGILMSMDALTNPKGITKGSFADSFLATSSRDQTARVWRRSKASGKWYCMALAEGHTGIVGAVSISSSTAAGQFYIVTGATDRTLKKWSLDGAYKKGESLERLQIESDPEREGTAKSDALQTSDENENVVQLSATWTTLAHEKDINTVAISPEGSVIATGSQDRTVKLWNASKGTILHTCSGHRRGVWNVTFSSVDRIVASSSADSTIRVWNVSSGACLRSFEGHLSGVLRSIFISSGTQIASSGADGLLKVWGTRSGECAATIDAHENRAWGLDKIEDGKFLFSAGADGLGRMWRDATEEQKLAEVEKKEEEALMAQEVQNAARDGRWVHAARGALRLGMRQKMRSIVMSLISSVDATQDALKKMIIGLKEKPKEGEDEKEAWALITKLFLFCRDWNASGGAKNAAIAAHVLKALFSAWTPDILCDSLNVDRRALVEALNAHCSRHLERVSQFSGQLAVLEHTLQQMRGLGEMKDNPEEAVKQKRKRQGEEGKKPKRKRKRREDFPSEY